MPSANRDPEQRRTGRLWRRRLALALALSVLGACAPSASADFQPRAFPCPGTIAGFAVAGSDWLTMCVDDLPPAFAAYGDRHLRISHDSGQTWGEVHWPAAFGPDTPHAAGVVTGPDGAFYLSAIDPTCTTAPCGRVLRVDAASGTLTDTGDSLPVAAPDAVPVLGTVEDQISPPAWDSAGRRWVAYTDRDTSRLLLARLGAEGVPDLTASHVSDYGNGGLEVAPRSSGIYVRQGTIAHRLQGDTLVDAEHGLPQWEEGGITITRDETSIDGGRSYEAAGGLRVEGDDALLFHSRTLLRRFSPALWSPTGLTLPDEITRVLRTSAGLVAVADTWMDTPGYVFDGDPHVLAVHDGAVPDPPFASGPLSGTFAGWLRRADALRAQAGLPPLLGDPKISQAAENHSRYWTLNPPPSDDAILSYHEEVPGSPGFTGVSMVDRCAAVGTLCFGEVMYPGNSEPIDGWVATVFHRSLIMAPTAFLVGGGQVGDGPAVMDAGEFTSSIQVAPIVFPRGGYDGDLAFSGEAPDPAIACADRGEPIRPPFGTTVTAWVPGGEITGWSLTDGHGTRLPGCTLGESFVPEDPLEPRTTYTASVAWAPDEQDPQQTISWQFTTADGYSRRATGTQRTRRRCSPFLTLRAPRVRRPAAVTLPYRTCARGRVTIRFRRLTAAGVPKRRVSRRATRWIPAAGRGAIHVSSRPLRPGRYRLHATLAGRRPAQLTRMVRVLKAHRATRRLKRSPQP